MSIANKGPKILKTLGFIALIGIIFAVVRLIIKGVRSANAKPEEEDFGV